MKTKRRFGYVMAGPAQFAIHRRRGRTIKVGQGISFLGLPYIDRYYIIPSTAQSVSFAADQITAENQGVEVAGFAVWRIAEPEKAAACFDFADSPAALATIGDNLRNVVESAIRHQVANMTIEAVLRKRGSIILQLKDELAYIAGQWGLIIETVEIRTVKVLSAQLFAQMQASFRDRMRLESESSALKTEQELAERRLAQKEELALKEQEFGRREMERRSEAEKLKIAAEAEVQGFRLNQQRELVAEELRLHEARAALETARKEHGAALATIEDETRRRQIETANTEDRGLALVRQMPGALGALRVTDLHIGDDPLGALAKVLTRSFRKDDVSSGQEKGGQKL
jgi:SPFH domain / Band 7 family